MNSPLTLRLAALVFSAAPAGAAIKTWDGSTSGNWSTTANWTTSPVPAAADDLVFPVGGANKAMTNNLASGLAFKTLSFQEGGYSIGMLGGTNGAGGIVAPVFLERPLLSNPLEFLPLGALWRTIG